MYELLVTITGDQTVAEVIYKIWRWVTIWFWRILRLIAKWFIWGVILQIIQGSGFYDIQANLPVIYDAGTAMMPIMQNLSHIALRLLELFGT